MIKCLICNKEFEIISFSHLKKHNVTFDDYRQMFPTAKLCSNEVSNKLREHCKMQHSMDSSFGFQNGHKVNKGLTPWNKGLTKEEDERVLKYAKKLKGREVSYSTRQKLSKSKKEYFKNHPESILRGEKHGMYGRKLTREHLNALWTSYMKQTKPEKFAEMVLLNFGFIYTGQRKFWVTFKDGKHKCPDFVNKDRKMIVEVYGDYWHRNDNPQDIIDKYAEIGWKCFVFWEHEIYDEVNFNVDVFAQLVDEFEMEDFSYEDFDGKWML